MFETDRLILREYRPSDEPFFIKLFNDYDVLLGVTTSYVAPNSERIAVFCHGGFGLAWLAHLLEIPLALMWSGFWLPPSSVTTIFLEQRTETWAVPRCVGLGDVSHLYAAGLPIQPRGIHATNW